MKYTQGPLADDEDDEDEELDDEELEDPVAQHGIYSYCRSMIGVTVGQDEEPEDDEDELLEHKLPSCPC